MDKVKELIVDAYGCKADLSNETLLMNKSIEAVQSIGATVAETASHRFQPHGLTLCLILKESHLVLSTWPEYEYATVNIFLCNSGMDPKDCWEFLKKTLRPEKDILHYVTHDIQKLKKAA
ncbi:MAG: adenosylmethionine decarboxylase [Bdellovibrionales bacterium]|nr:adenosylmethionine decarboxylase [Bdellovibrionales bacterium]